MDIAAACLAGSISAPTYRRPVSRQARAIGALDNKSPWGYRPHERFAETFAVVFHPILATERMLPADWAIPPLDDERRGRLRAFYAGLPRRAGPYYMPIDMYDPTTGADSSVGPSPGVGPSPDMVVDDLGTLITAFWQRDDIPDWFREWSGNFERQYGERLRRLA